MEVFTVFLESAGYSVLQATRAEEGVRLAQEIVPDLILMDVFLPSMNGLQATEILKKDKKTRDIPIIALTAYAMSETSKNCLEAGCDGFLTKPIGRERLLQEISHRLRQGVSATVAFKG